MTADDRDAAHLAAETSARTSYGRLLAYLASRFRDVASAEDALADALVAALERWPIEGVPSNPSAWLLTTAQRRLLDRIRHAQVRETAALELRRAAEQSQQDPSMFPDDRLKLLFVCAHPAIDESMHTPLMLQTVLGLDARRIASAFLIAPSTMGQRLSRVKAKIRDAGIRFGVPDAHELAPRLQAVLDAIYAAYGTAWDNVAGADETIRDLASEAVWLGRLVVQLLPGEPEALGLLALMLHCEARRAARRDAAGQYVALSAQDTERWSRPMIDEAEALLRQAAIAKRVGRFQLEAAIQSVHAQRAVAGATDWEAIALLYEGLTRIAPSVGASVAGAAALAQARGYAAGLRALERVDDGSVAAYQPYWALRAPLLARAGRAREARDAYTRAIGLSDDPSVRAFLIERSGQA